MKKIEIFAGAYELTLIQRALEELHDKIQAKGDIYNTAQDVAELENYIAEVRKEIA